MMRSAFPMLVVVLAIAIPAHAEHCWPMGSEPEVSTGATIAGEFYLDHDLCQPECLSSIWVYQESNGISGLQRGDAVVDDTCHGIIRADTIVQAVYA